MAPKRRATETAVTKPANAADTDAVQEFLRSLDHPLKPALALVRAAIRRSGPEIAEEIRWGRKAKKETLQEIVRQRIGGVLLLSTLLSAGSACGSGAKESQPPPKPPVEAGARAALRAEEPSIAPGDADAIATFVGLPARWNAAAAPLVRDYRDPSFPVDRWVKETPSHIEELRAVRGELQACVAKIQDPGIRRTFEGISANYGVKLDAVVALHDAVAKRDRESEDRARETLSAAAAEGQKMAQALLDRLTPYVDPQVLTEELRKRGRAIDELMAPP